MSIKFGTFVPQGWRMDLVEIRDPVEQYEAMTHIGKEVERLQRQRRNNHPPQQIKIK